MMNSSSRLITPDGGPITRWVVSIGVAEADVRGEAEVTTDNATGLTIEKRSLHQRNCGSRRRNRAGSYHWRSRVRAGNHH